MRSQSINWNIGTLCGFAVDRSSSQAIGTLGLCGSPTCGGIAEQCLGQPLDPGSSPTCVGIAEQGLGQPLDSGIVCAGIDVSMNGAESASNGA